MACCDKIRLDRLRDFEHMKIMAYRFAQVTNKVTALYKNGDVYDFINYSDAREQGIKILRKYSPGDSI